MNKRRYAMAAALVASTGLTMTTGSAGAAAGLPEPAVYVGVSAAPEEGVEKAVTSSLAPIKLPDGALRSTNREDIAKFEDALEKIAAAGEGKVGKVEVLIWQGESAGPMKAMPERLKEAGFGYAAQPVVTSDGMTLTPFGAPRKDRKGSGLVGMWIEQDGLVLLSWGVFTANGGGGEAASGKAVEEVLPQPEPVSSPKSAPAASKGGVPADLLGDWSWTTISSVNYQNQTTGQLAEPSGMSTRFTFTRDGRYKFFFFVRQRTYGLVSQSTTTAEGTVKFGSDGTFTLYPDKGHYKGNNGSTPIDRPMTAAERKPSVYSYEWRTENGKRNLYVVPGTDRSGQMSRFKRPE